MMPGEFEESFERFRDTVDGEATSSRRPQDAFSSLVELYRSFAPPERQMADEVIMRWLRSDDEARRWDAQALIREFRIVSAVPTLSSLSEDLRDSSDPGAPYERAKVMRLIDLLTKRPGR